MWIDQWIQVHSAVTTCGAQWVRARCFVEDGRVKMYYTLS
jgi:hypothetical protein